jgi:antiphage defense system Thoeris ThsB-like protein
MAGIPVFISFDYDHDQDCKTLLVGQAKNPDTPFEIQDWSVKVASPTWKAEARSRIKRAKQVIVICGAYTDSAAGVNVEIEIAREEKKPYFLLNGRPNGPVKKPSAALSTDKIYKWTWENLKALIAGAR